jgi:hypothetical protein
VSLVTRSGVIVADIVVLAVTLKKALNTYREARRHNLQVPLAEILVRDGQFISISMTQYLRSDFAYYFNAGILFFM